MRAGLLVLCDLPEQITGNTDLNPQRIQVVVGFVYTATSAVDEPGGFNIGNLVGSIDTPALAVAPPLTPTLVPDVPAVPGLQAPPAPAPVKRAAPIASVVPPRLTEALDSAMRWTLAIICLVAWAALTHLGITKLRRVS